jgi:hypothetical protein
VQILASAKIANIIKRKIGAHGITSVSWVKPYLVLEIPLLVFTMSKGFISSAVTIIVRIVRGGKVVSLGEDA